ncbi:hypothetical protein OOT46_12735 [Aquabacterium sp. A7-Y]|uniref:hypothetical protein n=1 Tax=Aquabacterium sp. A7-Y TaxID=1349605 RepID=UPI00223D175B|nr:hypothetical protein [Aquabacterium sp. A7-Y]MCW7538710.1 hypothetical protein [Aquabacterium sp. A7-Y]
MHTALPAEVIRQVWDEEALRFNADQHLVPSQAHHVRDQPAQGRQAKFLGFRAFTAPIHLQKLTVPAWYLHWHHEDLRETDNENSNQVQGS